jgi:hypothetical protein
MPASLAGSVQSWQPEVLREHILASLLQLRSERMLDMPGAILVVSRLLAFIESGHARIIPCRQHGLSIKSVPGQVCRCRELRYTPWPPLGLVQDRAGAEGV